MALPVAISQAQVTWGAWLGFFGQDANGTVTVEPLLGGNARSIVWAATGQPLVASAQTVTFGAGQAASFHVPHVDQAGFIDGTGNAFSGWSYRAAAQVKVGAATVTFTKVFQAQVGQASINLDLIPDGTMGAPSSAPLPAVLSVNGSTGHVTVEGGGGGGALLESRVVADEAALDGKAPGVYFLEG